MAKLKMSLTLFFALCICLFAVVVFGASESETETETETKFNQSENSTLNVLQNSHISLAFGILEVQQFRLEQLEKSREELKEQVKSLRKEVDDLKEQVGEDGGLSLLTLPLTGPPGKQGEKGDRGLLAAQVLKSCGDAMEIFQARRSNNQEIYPYGNSKGLEVLCDFETDVDGGGWTVIQKRSSGPKDEFRRNWNDYAKGFGSLDGNFWLGLENIRALTKNVDQELRIELEDFEGVKKWAKYSNFSVSDASDFYRLYAKGFSRESTSGDSLQSSTSKWILSGKRFSTFDRDNDHGGGNCAADRGGGGWWFNNCGLSNLNGRYYQKGENINWAQGIRWESWKEDDHSLAKTEMKIRKRK